MLSGPFISFFFKTERGQIAMGCFGKQSPCVDPLQPRLVCVRFEALFWLGSGQIPLTTPSWGGGRIASFHFRSQAASFLLIKFAFLGLCDQLRLASNCLGNGCNHQTQDDGRGHYVSGCLSASCGGLHNRGGESLLSLSRAEAPLFCCRTPLSACKRHPFWTGSHQVGSS